MSPDEAAVVRNTSTPAVPEPTHDMVAREMVTRHLQAREDKVRQELETLQVCHTI